MFHWVEFACPEVKAFREGKGPAGVRIGFCSALSARLIKCEACLDALSTRFWQMSIRQDFRNRAATESRTFLPKPNTRMPGAYIEALAQLVKQAVMAMQAERALVNERMTKSQRSRYGREPEGKVINFPGPWPYPK